MHRNSKEKRLDCSKNYGEGVSKLRNDYKKISSCHFYAPEGGGGGVLAEIVIFFSLSLLSTTKDSVADPGEGPGPYYF